MGESCHGITRELPLVRVEDPVGLGWVLGEERSRGPWADRARFGAVSILCALTSRKGSAQLCDRA